MKKKSYLTLDDEFILYCQLNNINDTDKLAKEIFDKGFALIKYGETPVSIKAKEKIIEKEIIKEVIREIPVEKIVEIIKEVPIHSEPVIVTKEIVKTDDEEIKRCQEENKKLKEDLDKINKSLDNLNKAKFMRNSDMSSLYGE